MARRLKQHELATLMNQVSKRLQEQLARYPYPRGVLSTETYLEQKKIHDLVRGRWFGLHDAFDIVLQQRRWGPVAQARAHDKLIEKVNAVWEQRVDTIAKYAEFQLKVHEHEAYTMYYTGQLDALRAVSKAIAGYPMQLQALLDIEHPEHARE